MCTRLAAAAELNLSTFPLRQLPLQVLLGASLLRNILPQAERQLREMPPEALTRQLHHRPRSQPTPLQHLLLSLLLGLKPGSKAAAGRRMPAEEEKAQQPSSRCINTLGGEVHNASKTPERTQNEELPFLSREAICQVQIAICGPPMMREIFYIYIYVCV